MGAGLLAMASPGCASQTALCASQASQLPQFLRCSQNPGSTAYLCGSGLARDGIPGVRQPDRVVCIAGKPAPTVFAVLTKSGVSRVPLWERACSRWHPRGAPAKPRCVHRRQASSHRFCGAHKIRGQPRTSVGAGLLAMASPECASQTALFASQAIQLPQVLRCSQNPGSTAYLCGSGLARDGIPGVLQPDRVVCIAGKPAPTGFAVLTKSGVNRVPLWERACSRWHPRGAPARPRCVHRRQSSSHRFAVITKKSHDISRQTMPVVAGPLLTNL
ncbi:hypothetical protein PS685_02180 [Pseudomonas fluorescens]|uniref:Uncharacterized protein n=1 Tax=Pseudomonas fluorescens TaxID=294 RepID=A0A5E6YSY0_PSEFL|nr:hypothetical protein PS685_02180 [Pseudomonas fluorescens]